jgi:formylglycine-generating enzyme required for sulfatase activity
MGKYQVTQAQWKIVAGFPKVNLDLESDPSHFKGDNRPVEKISWDKAVEFCARLSKRLGCDYRLPSEAEWEYACRARTTTPFYFGDTITTDLVNYDGNYTFAKSPKGKYREETTPVGIFPPNAFGLYDMHGNVYEWCQDAYRSNYEGAPTDGSAWVDENDNQYRVLRGGSWDGLPELCRVLRGGSWDGLPELCRSASRNGPSPGLRFNSLGFRVALSGVSRTLN